MAFLDVLPNGNAPANAKVGDTIKTAGGNYMVVSPGAAGSAYNPDSGLWSVKMDHSLIDNSLLAYMDSLTEKNSALSQQFAERQMQFQTEANAKAMQFSAEEAQKNRDFQERMSSTSYQRAVKDLMAAGLNPVLAAMSGGSSTPSGSAASGVTSAGASGTVDNSQLAFIGSIISALINQKTAMYTSDNALQASMYSANTSAKTEMFLQSQEQAFDTYLREKYPDNEYQMINVLRGYAKQFFEELRGYFGDRGRDVFDNLNLDDGIFNWSDIFSGKYGRIDGIYEARGAGRR